MQTRREMLESRSQVLKAERQRWEPAWWDLAEQFLPYRVVKDPMERNQGEKREAKLINLTPPMAASTLASGMMTHITSPGRQWFNLTTENPDLADEKPVRVYLDACRQIVSSALQKSNFYTALVDGTYLDLGVFGTHLIFEEEGAPGEVLFHPHEVGEYSLDINHEGILDTVFRERPMTTRQMVQKFGLKKLGRHVLEAWRLGNYQQPFLVCHAVMPNGELQYGKSGPEGMPVSSCWWDPLDDRKDAVLREGGYHEFPAFAPCWSRRQRDAYGRGPGWLARGDARDLQYTERLQAKLFDKSADPSMKASGDVDRATLIPGDVTYFAAGSTNSMFEPSHEVDPQSIAECEKRIQRREDQINAAFFVDIWRAFLDDDRAQPTTATEVEEKRKEKMLLLGPMLQNLEGRLLKGVVERTVNILDRNDFLPIPPRELEGSSIRVEFQSILHLAQQVPRISGVRALVQETLNIAQADPGALDKLNTDVLVDEVAQSAGVNPAAVRSNDEVAKKRRARADAEQAKQQGEAMLAATQGAKNLGNVDPQKISQIAGALSPAAAAQAGALAGVRPQ